MIDAEPYFYDPTTLHTAWKKGGVWQIAVGRIWSMNRNTVRWSDVTPEQAERFEGLCVSV